MARKAAPAPMEDFDEHIVDTDIREEMRASFLEYSYSVIYARALPDARDGLKPVQRRILYTMDDLNLRHDRGHVKSARVVGEVMGRLHPHGDSAIYDAQVRLIAPWSMRLPLVDGHGNFGSPDDPPAAMRYTECRMDQSAEAMTASIDEDTVDFKPNYDGRETEPVVLPAALPNLLVNGASGIAVGMATNIAPHNLIEVVQALRHLIDHPAADLDDLMKFVPGPDLPTGGKIVGLDGIRDAYATGNGSFKMRASTSIERIGRREAIVITELPYNVGPEKVIESIKKLVQSKKLQGIADIKNLTDRHSGLNLVIELKTTTDPNKMLGELFRSTPMESSFGINAVALVDGQPRTLGLKQMLEVYLQHRYDVVRRRTEFRRKKAADRLHLVEGLLIAIVDIDEVIQLIRSSDNRAEARARLMEVFDLSDLQADFILDRTLGSLTKFSRIELESEADALRAEIEKLEAILADSALLRSVVGDELAEMAQKFGTPRRTLLTESDGQATVALGSDSMEIADDPCWAFLSGTGLLARSSTDDPIGPAGRRAKHDVIVSAVRTTARGEIGVVTTKGVVKRISVAALPALPPTADAPSLSAGVKLAEFGQVYGDPLALMTFDTDVPGIALGTKSGQVKRVKPDYISKDEFELIKLAEGDLVVGAAVLDRGDEQLAFVTSDAQLLHFPADAVRPQGRSGGGIAGIRVVAGQSVVAFGAVRDLDAAHVVTIAGSSSSLPGTQTGAAKVSALSIYPAKGRATGGIRCHRLLKGEDALIVAWVGDGVPMACADAGSPVDLPEPSDKRDGSGIAVAQPIRAISGPPS